MPLGNLLDNELVFVNYRLMAMKTGQVYEGIGSDTALKLWLRGVKLACLANTNIRAKFGHLAWLSALLVSPHPVARRLIDLRFNRAEIARRLKLPFMRAGIYGGNA